MKKRSSFNLGLVWFGAGVSLAEILTGTYYSDLGFSRGLAAILVGHLIGGVLMLFAGLIGACSGKSAMEGVKFSFGSTGGKIFAMLNVLQLVGWTGIMIYDGALAADGIFGTGKAVWACVIGGLIIVWILLGAEWLEKINLVAMAALFILSLLMLKLVFADTTHAAAAAADAMSFGAAVELGVAMPLSWLPLISDYTRDAKSPVAGTVTGVVVYNIVSIFMYVIGMGAALFAGTGDIAQIMVSAGFGIAGLVVIVFSTVTTTYLDAYSAGVSWISVTDKFPEKAAACAAAVIGLAAAVVYPMDDITDFLYLIGSVFAPMIAVQIADNFILRRNADTLFAKAQSAGEGMLKGWDIPAIVVWVAGFIIYRMLMRVDTPVGNSLPDMLITMVICVAVRKMTDKRG